jgi:hypothetical protein
VGHGKWGKKGKSESLRQQAWFIDKFAAFREGSETPPDAHHSVFRPHILNEEPGSAGGDDARVRRLAAALRVEDRGVQHHRYPAALLLWTPGA